MLKSFKLNYRENPAGNYMFNVNKRNVRTRCKTCSKLTIKIKNNNLKYKKIYLIFKGAVTDRYFARSNFPRSLVYKKNFSLT